MKPINFIILFKNFKDFNDGFRYNVQSLGRGSKRTD